MKSLSSIKIFFVLFFIFLFFLRFNLFAQDDSVNANLDIEDTFQNFEDENEIIILESFVTPDEPFSLILKFLTIQPSTTKLKLFNTYEYEVSKQFETNHSVLINLSNIKLDKTIDKIEFIIFAKTQNDKELESEVFEVLLPETFFEKIESTQNLLSSCLLGSTIFLVPSAGIYYDKKFYNFTLNKELPFASFYRKKNFKPYLISTLEYNYISKNKNSFGRLAAKYLLHFSGELNFISIGASYFIDFKENKGFSFEFASSFFDFYRIFSFYLKFRYSYSLKFHNNFYDAQLGIFSYFFTFKF